MADWSKVAIKGRLAATDGFQATAKTAQVRFPVWPLETEKRHIINRKIHSRPGPRRRDQRPQKEADGTTLIYGLHAAQFALDNPKRRVNAVFATQNAERKLAASLAQRSLSVTEVSPQQLDRRLGADTVHQGVLLEVEPLETVTLEDLAISAHETGLPIVILDQVTDPHNVGAVLRSCSVFGSAGLIMTSRHSPPLGATLAKSASGALDLLPIALVQNLSKAIDILKQQSIAVIGLDGEPQHRLLEAGIAAHQKQPLAFVLGAEGKGLRELTRQSCDELCRIGGDGPIASLNVSNAAAISLHLTAMTRRQGS